MPDDRNRIHIPFLLWQFLLKDLRRRGDGKRESGAFLLGKRLPTRQVVKSYVLYDDLDPEALSTGIVVVGTQGIANLWRECRERGMHVLADIHTHPGIAKQSSSDQAHPMMKRAGHIALIVPRFAAGWHLSLSDVGVFEYLGDKQWRALDDQMTRSKHVRLSAW